MYMFEGRPTVSREFVRTLPKEIREFAAWYGLCQRLTDLELAGASLEVLKQQQKRWSDGYWLRNSDEKPEIPLKRKVVK